jgi:hypothetical protein
MRDEVPSWSWQEGQVDQNQSHFNIYYVPDTQHEGPTFLIAVISPPKNQVFLVQLFQENLPATLDPGPIIDGAKEELNFFIVERQEKDTMKYLQYHCTTVSNIYSQFQWAYIDNDPQ